MSLSVEFMYRSKVRQDFTNELKSNQIDLLNLSSQELNKNHNSSSFSSKKECMMYKNDYKIQKELINTNLNKNTLGNKFNSKMKKFNRSIKFSFNSIKNKLIKKNTNEFIIEYKTKQTFENELNLDNTDYFIDYEAIEISNNNNLNLSNNINSSNTFSILPNYISSLDPKNYNLGISLEETNDLSFELSSVEPLEIDSKTSNIKFNNVFNKNDSCVSSIDEPCQSSYKELNNLTLECNYISDNFSSYPIYLDKYEEEDNIIYKNKIENSFVKIKHKNILNSALFDENINQFDFNYDFDYNLKKNNMSLKDELELVYSLERQNEIKISNNNVQSFLIQSKNIEHKIQNLELELKKIITNLIFLKSEQKKLKENKLILEGKLRPIITSIINLEIREKYLSQTKDFININKLILQSQKQDLNNEIIIFESKILLSLSQILLLEKNERILKDEISLLKNKNELKYNKIPISKTIFDKIDILTKQQSNINLKKNNINFYTKSCGLYLLDYQYKNAFIFTNKTNIERLLYSILIRIKNELLRLDLLWIPY